MKSTANSLRLSILLGAICIGVSLTMPVAHAQQPFYKGKRLTVLVNFAAGGPADIESRVVAKHLVKHIDGQPSLVMQNMDGAGGLVGAQYVGEVAAKDGTVLGALTGTAWVYVSDPSRWRVDLRRFEFVARQPSTTVYFIRTDVAPGLRVPADVAKAQGVIIGGLSAEFVEGSAVAHDARPLGRAAPARHRLPVEPGGASGAPARRDQHVLGIPAELSLCRGAATGDAGNRDRPVLR